MDEPLASLDAARKAEIFLNLIRLKTWMKLPILYVTHALDEIVRLIDSLVLIDRGHVVAFGSVSDVRSRSNLPLAQRDDAGVLLVSWVTHHDVIRVLTRLTAGGETFWVFLLDLPPGSECRIRIPAREVILAGKPPEAISLHHIFAGTVRRIRQDTVHRSVMAEVAPPNVALLSRVTPNAILRLGLSPGSGILALIKSTSMEVVGSPVAP